MRWLTMAAVIALAGCCSVECMPERLPARGVPKTSEELFKLVQHAAQNDCGEVLYDAMSKKTRGEHSYLKLKVGLRYIEVPEPWEYKVMDVIEKGEFIGAFPGPRGQELVIVSYQEKGKPELMAQILVTEERNEAGKKVKVMALEEQRARGPAFNQLPPPEPVGKGKK